MRLIERRKRELTRRKNFLPTFLVIIVLWIANGVFVYAADPDAGFAIPVFFLLAFVTLFFTLAVLFANTRRGALGAGALVLFLVLRYFGVGNIINLALIIGAFGAFEIYFSKVS